MGDGAAVNVGVRLEDLLLDPFFLFGDPEMSVFVLA